MKLKHSLFGAFTFALLPVMASAQTNSATTLDTVTVTAESPNPYTAPEAVGALKTDAPLLTTPQAVSVITSESIRDRGVQRIVDAVRNTSGVTVATGHPGYYAYKLRGYDATWDTYVDGLRQTIEQPVWSIERLEVLKGPSSSLYGQSVLGGLVNIVTKRPKPNDFGGEVMVGGGSFDLFEAGIDLNVPLITSQPTLPAVQDSGKSAKNVLGKGVQQVVAETSEGQTLTARFNAYYRDGGLHYRDTTYEQLYLSGSLLWQISPDTSFTLLANYYDSTQSFMWGLPARGTIWTNPHGEIDIRNYPASTDKNLYGLEVTTIGYEFKHAFSDAVSFRQNVRFSREEFFRDAFEYPGGLTNDLRSSYVYAPYYFKDRMNNIQADTAVDIKFTTGALSHTLTPGFDFIYTEEDFSDAGPEAEPQLFNLFSGKKQNFNWPKVGKYESYPTESFASYGFYLQDRITLLDDKLAIVLGGRYDISRYDNAIEEFEESAFTGRVGISYEIAPGIAPYASYARSFYPQWFSTDKNGQPLVPEEGSQWEAGIKTSLLDGSLVSTLSAFQLTRENVGTDDLSTADPFDSIVTGEQEIRGVEFETIAQLAPGLEFTFAYTYLDSEITEDNYLPVGARVQGVPDHTVSTWLKYTFQEGFLKGFGVGLGGRYISSQAGDTEATFDLPSYALMDAAVYYERGNFTAQVNFNNVTNERYFPGSFDRDWVFAGAPFNVSAQVSWKF